MRTKNFLLAAGISLAFVFTFSCSGDDGERGEQGADGVGCYVSTVAQGTQVTCGENSVIIPNGSDGAKGNDGVGSQGPTGPKGEGCEVEKLDDTGFVITCGGNKVGIAFCGDDNTLYNPLEQLCDNGDIKNIFTDSRDDKQYAYVEIGDYLWMADNLTFGADDGKYTWDEAQTACPAGWKLPTQDEAQNAKDNYGTEIEEVFIGYVDNGNNDRWWTATEHSNTTSAYFYGYDEYDDFNIGNINKAATYFVRCVKEN